MIFIDNPSDLPEPSKVAEIREPIIEAHILVPQSHLGNVINLCIEKRGMQKNMQYLGGQVQVTYDLPMNVCHPTEHRGYGRVGNRLSVNGISHHEEGWA